MADNFTAPDPGIDPDAITTATDFTRALRALRDRANLTIREVARRSGASVSTAGDYFSGRHLPLDREQFARVLAACGETDQAQIERWQVALVRIRRLPGRRGEPPYRGLARFEAADARWFFGRDDVTDLLASLAAAPSQLPLLLVGPSGAGKSSLLRAGLVPRLREADAGPAAAAGRGGRNGGAGPGDGGDGIWVLDLTAAGVAELSATVTKLAAQARPGAGQHPGGRPALIVDQFEAIFTLVQDESDRRAMISELCDLARDALVVLALRADFYDHAVRYPGMLRALQQRQVVLGPMTAGQLRQAVLEPAKLARVHVEDGLVDLVLSDVAPHGGMAGDGPGAYEAGALPLLSHALLTAWEHSKGGALTVADYLEGGGITDALTRSAEQAYESLAPAQRRLARQLFLRLVHVTDDLPPSRASVPLSELLAWLRTDSAPGDGTGGPERGAPEGGAPEGGGSDTGAERVLAVFVEQRMITVNADAAQLTHEALLVAWPRLRDWIAQSAEELRTRRRISQGAHVWAETGREDAQLWRGSQLALAREWATDPGKRAELLPAAREFVDASVAADTARELQERRRVRRLRSIVAVLSVLVLAVAGLTGYAFSQRQAASAAEASAVAAEHAAIASENAANSRTAAFLADQLRTQEPTAAAQLSLVGYALAHTPQATASVLEASGAPMASRIVDTTGGVAQWASVSPDRRLLAAAGADGTLRLWDVAVPGRPVPLATLVRANSKHPLYVVEFSPNGRLLAAAGAGRVVHLWTVSGSHATPVGQPLAGPANTIYSVAFSPDGRLLAVGSADGTVRLWSVADPAHAVPAGRPLKMPGAGTTSGYVESVAFSPDGRALAAGTASSTVWLWNVTDPAHPVPFRSMPLTGPGKLVSGVAFSPDGRTLAATSHDDKVWLWSVRAGGASGSGGTAKPDGTLTGANNWTNAVAFSPDSRLLAVGTSDSSVLVWNLATRTLAATLPQPQPVTSVSWDGTGRLVSSDADGVIDLWTLPTPVLYTTSESDAVAYRPDGRVIAVGGDSIQLWDAATRTLLVTRALPSSVSVNSVAFNHGGTVLAAALSNGTVTLLNGQTLAPLSPAFTVTRSGMAESVAFSPDGTELLAGSDDGSVRLFDVTDPAHPRKLAEVRDAGNAVYTVAFASDGTTVAAASLDNLVRLWHVSRRTGTGSVALTRTGPALGGMASYAIGLAFSPDGRVLAVGSADKTVRLWNVADPAHPALIGKPLTGPEGYVWAAAFSPDGKTLAVGVTDNTVWLWNVADPARPRRIASLTSPADHVYAVAFSPSGAQLAATSYEGTVHLWDTSPAAAIAATCANLGQPLTRAEWASYAPGVPYRKPCP